MSATVQSAAGDRIEEVRMDPIIGKAAERVVYVESIRDLDRNLLGRYLRVGCALLHRRTRFPYEHENLSLRH